MPDIRNHDLIKLANALFNEFCLEHGVTVAYRPGVNPMAFFRWLGTWANVNTAETVAATFNITVDSVTYVMSLVERPDGVNAMMGMWPYMTLSHHPRKHEVKSANLMMVVTWADGTVVPISIFAHRDVCPDPIDTAAVCAMVTTRVGDLANQIGSHGLDAIHDGHPEHKGLADPSLPAVLARLCAAGVDRNVISHDEAALVMKMATQIQSMFPDEVPEALQTITGGPERKPRPRPDRNLGGFDAT